MVGVRALAAKARAVGAAVRADARGWLICGAVLAVTVVRSGVTYSFGMFVVQLHHKFPQLNLAEQSTSTRPVRMFRVVAISLKQLRGLAVV